MDEHATMPPISNRLVTETVIAGREVTPNTQGELENQARLFEDRFYALGHATGSIVWRAGPSGRDWDTPDWNRITGQSGEDGQGVGWLEMIHPDDQAKALATWEYAVESRSLYADEYRLLVATGEYRWCKARGVPILNSDGTVREWVGLCEDIHQQTLAKDEQLAAQVAVRQSEQWYRLTFDNAAVGIAHVGLDGRWLKFNDTLCKILGYPREELVNLTFGDITHPDDLVRDLERAKKFVDG